MLSKGSPLRQDCADGVLTLVLFFLSGSSGLIYEVVWSRSLVLVFGSTTHAVSTVLAAFMGGLALGSLVAGRRGDRLRSPLRVYACLEAGIAACAMIGLAASAIMVPLYRLAWSLSGGSVALLAALRFPLACLVLLPPAALMGATLPILSAHVERAASRSLSGSVRGGATAALYAVNTIGAVAGTLAAGFVLLPALGMTATALVAAAANLAAAAMAWKLSARRDDAFSSASIEPPALAPTRGSAPGAAARSAVLMLALATSGAGALVFEVVWTRALSMVLGSSTQAFTIMLATFLTGLAAGGAAAARLLRRLPDATLALAVVELGAGLSAFAGIWILPELPYALLALFRAAEGPGALFQTGRFLIASMVMLPPTLLLGAAFPLAARACLQSSGTVAARIGALYGANTIGAILGSCAAGFVLIPALGLQPALVAGCLLVMAAGAVLLAVSGPGRPALRLGLAGALAAGLAGLPGAAPPWDSALMASGVFQYAPDYARRFDSRRSFVTAHRAQEQLYYRDGPTTTIAVERRAERIEGQVNLVLTVNGKVDASSAGDAATQVLLGQLPLLAAPHARSAMVIGMGSGVSAGSALTHPIDSLTVVEIEPAVLEAARYFEQVNGRPLHDPRTTVRINDARNELLASDRRYDVIISEPSNPWMAGPSRLFTREFFELVRQRLNAGGVLCQWVQLYGLDSAALKTILRTYASVFPHRMVFKGSPGDLIVLGSVEPIRLDVDRIALRLQDRSVAADMARIKVRDAADLLAFFRLDGDGVDAFAGAAAAGPLNTDDNALVEFAAARTLYRQDHRANDRELARMARTVLPHLALPPDPTAREERVATIAAALTPRLLHLGLHERARALLDLAGADAGPSLPAVLRAELTALRGSQRREQGDAAGAEEAWRSALRLDDFQARARLGLASLRVAAGEPRAAVSVLQRACDHPDCDASLARALFLAGDFPGSLRAAERAEASRQALGAIEPEAAGWMDLYAGRSLLKLGNAQAAVGRLGHFFDDQPFAPRAAESSLEASASLAHAHLALGELEEALAQFRVAASLAGSLALRNLSEGQEALHGSDTNRAVVLFQAAVRWAPQDAGARRQLARLLTRLGRHGEAEAAWRDLDRQVGGDQEALRVIAGLSLQGRRPHDAAEAFRRLRGLEADPDILRRLDAAIQELEGGT